MILIGLGANLPSPSFGPPQKTLDAATASFGSFGISVTARSAFYQSAPVPASDQPWYVNRVVRVETGLAPKALLETLHEIERRFGRVRADANAPRVLDLDLIAYGERVTGADGWPVLPHPRMHERAFVLLPLAEIAPRWRHPASGAAVADLVAALPPGQVARPMAEPASPSLPGGQSSLPLNPLAHI